MTWSNIHCLITWQEAKGWPRCFWDWLLSAVRMYTIWYNPIVLRLRQRKSKPRSATVSGRTDAVEVATMVLISLTTAFQMDEWIIVGLGSVPLQHNARVCLIMINVSPWLGIRKYLGTIVQSAHHHLTSIKASNVVFPTKRQQDSPSIPFTLSSFPFFNL